MIHLELLKLVAKAPHQVPAAEYAEHQREREQLLIDVRKNHQECRYYLINIKMDEGK